MKTLIKFKPGTPPEFACGCMLLFFALFAVIGAFCWTYTLNTWLVFLGKPATVVWWQGAILGFIPWVGQASVPAAVVTWILMLFLA